MKDDELGVYRHTKTGRLYEVIGVAHQTETGEKLVVYRPLYESEFQMFARPYRSFFQMVEIDGHQVARFMKQ